MTRSALILSPFSSWPENAGHRRRVAQATRLLRDAGFRITFLLYAFEDAWARRFDEESYDALRRQWPEVHVFHANAGVGGTPEHGDRHAIDEWWDPALGAYLDNLLSRRRFDAFVIHNVWLSRAFQHAPPGTTKVLEMHDLFHRRAAVFDRLGLRPDFFLPTEAGEIEGLARADVISTIQASEQNWIQQRLPGRGRLVPYFDTALPRQATPRTEYLERDVVRFGILASGHSLNLHGIRALLEVLRAAPEADRRRVRLRIGGAAARFIAPSLPCERIPEVATEAGFYAGCDIAVVPNLDGTGFKIKIADALGLGMPVLTTTHGAEGVRLMQGAAAATPEDLAARMCTIARDRPPLATLRSDAAAAQRLRRDASRGASRLVTAIARHRPVLRIDLSAFTPAAGILPLVLMLNRTRLERLLQHGRPEFHLTPEVAALLTDLLPNGITVVPRKGLAPRARRVSASKQAFRTIRAGSWDDLEPLRNPGFRYDPLVARLLWARRATRGPMPQEQRPVLIAGPTVAQPDQATSVPIERHLVPTQAWGSGGWSVISPDASVALEDLAVAMLSAPGAGTFPVFWAAGPSPARDVLDHIAAASGHAFTICADAPG